MLTPTSSNRLEILRLIRSSVRITRRQLAERLSSSFSLVSRVTGELLELGLIQEAGRSEPLGGRPADLLMLAPAAAYVVGVDMGGDIQRAVLVDSVGQVVAHLITADPPASDHDTILERLEQIFQQVTAIGGVDSQSVLGLGVGLRALVDPIAGIVYGGPRAHVWADPWTGFPLLERLAARRPELRIGIDDIVRTLGLAEAHYGHGTGRGDFIYIVADSGLGMAVMIDGQPYLGTSRVTGEIGHISIGGASIPCYCGNTGCVEQLAATGAIVREVSSTLAAVPIQSILARPGSDLDITSIIAAAEHGDKLAYRIMIEAGEYFGAALAVVLNLLGPTLIVVGGELADSNVYLEAARRVMRLRAIGLASRDVVLARSDLDELAGARGAATLVLNQLFDAPEANILALRRARRSQTRRSAERFDVEDPEKEVIASA